MLECDNKYPNWTDFKCYVLDKIEEEFRGTWVEFTFEGIRDKGGKGEKITKVKLKFLNDIKRQSLIQNDLKYEWEDKLIEKYHFSERTVKKDIRQRIKVASPIADFEDRFWDVLFSLFIQAPVSIYCVEDSPMLFMLLTVPITVLLGICIYIRCMIAGRKQTEGTNRASN